ncbi:MAG TPA: hypothetical protein VMA09_18000 [Candidatus Binataceae bacterium]|nr:hypothetical protein [Candidatus Binataceae bacterium]
MVLVRNRRPEQGEDSVAGRLHDISIIAPHGVDHQLERRIDDLARLLGVEVLLQFGRALDVGEQCGHRLALAFENFAGRYWANPQRRLGSLDAGR